MGTKFGALDSHIEEYWVKLRQENTLETKQALGLPYAYYVPSVEVVDGFSFPHLFYWDTYFVVQGFWGTSRESEIVGLAENFFDLIRRFGFVPNSNSFAHLSRSQPPLLSSLVLQIHERLMPSNRDWLELAYARVREEYRTVWMGKQQPHNRQCYERLSRYYDTNVLHVLAEAESGWDYTTRFNDKCLNYLPVDLNALLYKYEVDMAYMAGLLNKPKSKKKWENAAERRKHTMNELMWNEGAGLYFDYNYKHEFLGDVESLASYAPMFVGMCTPEQAQRLVENLERFETNFGLSTTAKHYEPSYKRQWAAPNGWAPLHDFVVDGLLRYGYEVEARRIAEKWVTTVDRRFQSTGRIYEKYNVVTLNDDANAAVYPDQHGFGWTNGVTKKFIELLK